MPGSGREAGAGSAGGGEGARFTVREISGAVGGDVEGEDGAVVTGVAPVEEAGPGDLTFVVDERYARALTASDASAALVPRELTLSPGGTALIRVTNPRAAFGRLTRRFHPQREPPEGVHPTAVVDPHVELAAGVSIGPHAVIREDARIGAETRIDAHTLVGAGARIGEGCEIGAGCSILGPVEMGDRVRVLTGARLGTEGFGYAEEAEGAVHFPQIGGVEIQDDVEIGANVTVDRGALGDTVIGARTKIDNLVHVGHNVRIGEDCMIVAQVGIAGSVEVGDRVQMAGQAGIAGHLTIGDGARIAAQAGVIGDVPENATYSGYPARPHGDAMRASAALFRLPDLLRRVRELERRVGSGEEEA